MSYTPGATPLQVALFSPGHNSGTFSTGALGFTPKFAMYVGAVQTSGSEVAMATGFATGTGVNARANGWAYNEGSGAPQLPGGSVAIDGSAIGGRILAVQNTVQFSSFSPSLDVTAFGVSGISLTWSAPVNAHQGFLLVVG